MVTLQILVLSFLVRIQVAQLKRLSFEGRFFCWALLWVGARVVVSTNNKSSAFAIDASIGQCATLVAATLHLLPTPQSTPSFYFGYLILTARWLSRYENDLLLGQKPCAFFIRYRLYC